MAMGTVERKVDGYVIVDQKLRNFIFLYLARKFSQEVGSGATYVYIDPETALYRFGRGTPTAFSIYEKFGIRYTPKDPQHVWPLQHLSAEEVFVHSLLFAETKKERALACIFYLKVFMDAAKVAGLARRFGVFNTLRDVERFISHIELPKGYPTFEEFEDLLSLYGVKVRNVEFKTLEELGRSLRAPVKALLIGGGYMLLKGMKGMTKDIDLVVDRYGFKELKRSLKALGYRPVSMTENGAIYETEEGMRFDVFAETISGIKVPIEGEIKKLFKLNLVLPKPELIFLLKVISGRPVDLEDALIITKKEALKWPSLIELIIKLEKGSKRHLCLAALEGMESIESIYSVKLPITRKFRALALRHMILNVLKTKMTVKQIALKVGYSEAHIRNHLRRLMKEGLVKKEGKRYILR